MSRGTWDTAKAFLDFVYRAITLYGRPFQAVQLSSKVPRRGPATPHRIATARFRLFRFRSPLLSESLICFLFLQVLRCFSSPGSLRPSMNSKADGPPFSGPGFPIRRSPDRSLFSGSPRLIVAAHVLHRQLPPRHPLYALCSLTKFAPHTMCAANS